MEFFLGIENWDLLQGDGVWSTVERGTAIARNLLLSAGVIAAFVGLWFAYQRMNTDRRRQETEDLRRQIEVKRQISDNFTKAVELLGDSRRSCRLGGIYSLEQIMHNDEILCKQAYSTLHAFCEDRSRAEKNALVSANATIADDYESLLLEENQKDTFISGDLIEFGRVSPDVSASIFAIIRRFQSFDYGILSFDGIRAPGLALHLEDEHNSLVFRSSDLRNLFISGRNEGMPNASFSYMSFMFSNLRGAFFQSIEVKNLLLMKSNCEKMKISHCKFASAILGSTKISDAVANSGTFDQVFFDGYQDADTSEWPDDLRRHFASQSE